MGCGSSVVLEEKTNNDQSRRNTVISPPLVDVVVGDKVKKKNGRQVIFIFGGPGSEKGTIIHDLISIFGFKFVCAEELIFKNLPNKLITEGNAFEKTQDLVQLLKNDSRLLTLEWILWQIDREISNCGEDEDILIDVLPNLKVLLRVETFVNDCFKEMQNFEEKVNCSFAINLSVTKEGLLQHLQASCVSLNVPENSNTESTRSDEVDVTRTKKRYALYESCAESFLNYFDERLITVHSQKGGSKFTTEALQRVMANLDYKARRVVHTVVLFVLDENSYKKIDTNRYPMSFIELQNLVEDPDALPVKLLSVLAKHLDKCAMESRAFIVSLAGTSIDKNSVSQFTKPTIMFVDVDIGQLDYFVLGLKRETNRKKSLLRKKEQLYKAICTTANETLLFPENTDTELCRRIAICMAQLRDSSSEC